MVRVVAPSRLHFGLMSLGGLESGRRFGGAGLMVQAPGLTLRVEPAREWSATGPLAQRALAFARRFAESLNQDNARATLSPHSIVIEQAPPEHIGLGTGTQLGMTVAKALAESTGLSLGPVELAQSVGRGERSGIGVHGFAQGGFVVDGGKGPRSGVAPLLVRRSFPEEWSVVLILPRLPPGLHGTVEREAFREAAAQPGAAATADKLCGILLRGVLPALAERDLPTFGAALGEYNRLAGTLFRPWQGGDYGHTLVEEWLGRLRGWNIHGVGQSSWGPIVFGFVDRNEAAALSQRLKGSPDVTHWVMAADNRGCTLGG